MNARAADPASTDDAAAADEESRADARIGSVLQDKYQIVRLIGEGGMGRVYEARHLTTTRRVAVKFLTSRYETNLRVLQRFEREARAAGGLEHPNIAAVLDFGRTPSGVHYLVLEYLEGENCQKLAAREGSLPVPRALNIVRQVCDGLSVAHDAGVVHRDLKPANLFVCAHQGSSEQEVVKVLDFGIAKFEDSDGTFEDTPSSATLGTPRYMSPEQARGARNVDPRSDIYALGAILYELLTGRKAHAGDSPLEIIFNILNTPPEPLKSLKPELPGALIAAVERAMAPAPEQRFQSVRDLKVALEEFTWGFRHPPRPANEATLADTQASEEPERVEIELRRRALANEATPSTVTVAAPAASEPAGRDWGPWTRALALALVAIGMGGVGGWLAAHRAPRSSEPPAVAVPASVVVVPVPVARTEEPARAAVAPARPSPEAPVPATPAHAAGQRSPKVSRPASKPAGHAVAQSATSSVAAAPETIAVPVPPQPPAPAELWKADEGWLDRQR